MNEFHEPTTLDDIESKLDEILAKIPDDFDSEYFRDEIIRALQKPNTKYESGKYKITEDKDSVLGLIAYYLAEILQHLDDNFSNNEIDPNWIERIHDKLIYEENNNTDNNLIQINRQLICSSNNIQSLVAWLAVPQIMLLALILWRIW